MADNLLWHGADASLADQVDGDDDLLARALLFRLVAEQLADNPRHGACLDDYDRATDLLGW